MRKIKQKVDVYFHLDGDTSGQVLYYGMIGVLLFIMGSGTIAEIVMK